MATIDGEKHIKNDRLRFMTRVWHALYCAWYDHRDTHPTFAKIAGWLCDRVARFA